jgi:predicted Rossmann-fold nucleotide-binding protein
MKSRILVCGGRAYDDSLFVEQTLDNLRQYFAPEFCIIQGGAKGADALARQWARENGICCITVAANWDYYDKPAGSIRNGWMIDFCKPDLLVAFPGGPGTSNMMKRCVMAGIDVHAV